MRIKIKYRIANKKAKDPKNAHGKVLSLFIGCYQANIFWVENISD